MIEINKIKISTKAMLSIIVFLFVIILPKANANDYDNQIDNLRQELNCMKSKNSSNYIKTKEELNSLIKKSQKNYSDSARINDAKRLIREEKYNAALYELYDLIENGKELSKANEMLGDISFKTSENTKNAMYYFEKAVFYDEKNAEAQFKLGKMFLRENKNEQSIECFKKSIQYVKDLTLLYDLELELTEKIKPLNNYEFNMVYELLGMSYSRLNKVDAAAKAFNTALRYNPDDVFIKYSLANLFYENNRNENAIAVYNSILREIPYDVQIRILKAKSLAKSGNLLGANKEFLSILSEYPNSNQAKYGIYKIYEGKLNPSMILAKINANKPNYKPNERDLLLFANFLSEIGDTNSALAFKNEIKKYTPEQKPKIAVHKNINTEIDKTTLSKKPTEQQQIQKEIRLALLDKAEQERIKKAKEQKEKERRILEDKMIEFERSRALEKDPRKYTEYTDQLNEYLEIEPKDAKIYTAIANTYKLMDEPTSALRYYREAIKLNPIDSDLYFNLGLTYMQLNNFELAKENLDKAIKLDSNNQKAITLNMFVEQKLITNAINIAYAKFEKKDYISAYEILENNIKKFPKSPQLYYYRALVYDAMNRNSAQINDLEKAISIDPSYYMAYYQLAKTYEKIDEERKALITYERFLSTEPEEEDLVKEVQKKVEFLANKYY